MFHLFIFNGKSKVFACFKLQGYKKFIEVYRQAGFLKTMETLKVSVSLSSVNFQSDHFVEGGLGGK